jgi:hypothetical protein
MKIIRKENWNYTLYDTGGGIYLMEIIVSSNNAGWAVYEVIHRLNFFEKILIKISSGAAYKIAQKIRQREGAKN